VIWRSGDLLQIDISFAGSRSLGVCADLRSPDHARSLDLVADSGFQKGVTVGHRPFGILRTSAGHGV